MTKRWLCRPYESDVWKETDIQPTDELRRFLEFKTMDKPVEGLETVATVRLTTVYPSRNTSRVLREAFVCSENVKQSEELVTRSQAEAIIAAKDEALNGLLQALKHHTGDNHGLMAIRKLVECAEKAEADNAALTARVKELGAELDQAIGVIEDRSSEGKALEAKLAAAREGAVREIDGYTEYFRGLEKLPRSYVLRGMAELKRRVISTLEAKP